MEVCTLLSAMTVESAFQKCECSGRYYQSVHY